MFNADVERRNSFRLPQREDAPQSASSLASATEDPTLDTEILLWFGRTFAGLSSGELEKSMTEFVSE
jgi:hypothetical protein